MQMFANFAWGHRSEFLSDDIDSKCETHLLDPNFSNLKFLLPPEISTISIFKFEISLKNVNFSLKSGDFGVLLVEISEMLPVEISIIFFSSISDFTGKKYYVHTTHGALFFWISFSPPVTQGFAPRFFIFKFDFPDVNAAWNVDSRAAKMWILKHSWK